MTQCGIPLRELVQPGKARLLLANRVAVGLHALLLGLRGRLLRFLHGRVGPGNNPKRGCDQSQRTQRLCGQPDALKQRLYSFESGACRYQSRHGHGRSSQPCCYLWHGLRNARQLFHNTAEKRRAQLHARRHRLTEGTCEQFCLVGRLSLGTGQSLAQLLDIAHLKPGFFHDAQIFSLYFLGLRQAGGGHAARLGVLLPHLGHVLGHARVIHKDAVFVADTLRCAHHRLRQTQAGLASESRRVFQIGNGPCRLVQRIPA